MFSKQYYQDKQTKLQQKLAKIKDQYVVDTLNLAQRVSNEIQEIQIENNEISKIIQDNEETKTEQKAKVKIKKGK